MLTWVSRIAHSVLYPALNRITKTEHFGDIQTLSAALGHGEVNGCVFCKRMCKILSWVLNDPNHCARKFHEEVRD